MKKFAKLVSLLLSVMLVLSTLSVGAVAEGLFTAGEYTASAQGNNGPVAVTVVFTADAIESVVIGEHAETPGISDPAFEKIPADIVTYQSLAVDVVSGATNTSNAVLAAVADCVKQAGADPEALKIAIEKAAAESIVIDADVAIAGAGGAGLSAAVAAAEAGASVVVLEKTDFPMGATGMSAGAIAGAAREGDTEGTYNADQLYDFWMEIAEGKTDAAVTRKIADMSADSLNWLDDMGMEWQRAITGFYGKDILLVAGQLSEGGRLGSAGMMLIDTLVARAEELGVQIICSTPATEVLVYENGEPCGLVGTRADGSTVTINADKVILATGDYMGDTEQIYARRPDTDKVVLYGHTANMGDGIRMAVAIGAKESYGEEVAKGCYGAYAANFGTYQIGMLVNEHGERFVNEAVGYGPYYGALRDQIKQGNYTFWQLFDGKNPYLADCEAAVAAGTMVKADTIEELAALIGVNAENLVATAAAYDAMGTEDTQFGKMPEFMFGMSEAPFYATGVYPMALGTYGGLEIDADAHILKADGTAFENLYGAGDLVLRSFMVDIYPYSGTCIQYAISTGRIAGENAAK